MQCLLVGPDTDPKNLNFILSPWGKQALLN